MLWSVWFVMIGAYNGPIVWLPAMLRTAGFRHAAEASLVIAIAMLPPTVASTLLLDRFGRRPVIACALLLGAAGAALIGVARSEPAVVLGGAALAGGVLAAWPVILSYAAEFYPTRIRATAIGWASAAGRSASVLAPRFLAATMRTWTAGRGPALAGFAAALAAAAMIVLFIGEETAGRALEDVAEAGAQPASTGGA